MTRFVILSVLYETHETIITATEIKMRNPQLSDWSMPEPVSSHLRDSTTVVAQNKDNFGSNREDYNINQNEPNNQRKKRYIESNNIHIKNSICTFEMEAIKLSGKVLLIQCTFVLRSIVGCTQQWFNLGYHHCIVVNIC